MSGWENDDEVTTTYGTLQLAQKQAFDSGLALGVRQAVRVLEDTAGYGDSDWDLFVFDAVALINGDDK